MEETRTGSGLELRVVPSALLLILGGDIPSLVAVTPASAAAATFAHAMTDLGNSQGAVVISGSNTQRQEPVPAHTRPVTVARTYHPPA